MRAIFGRDPMAGSKKVTLKFIIGDSHPLMHPLAAASRSRLLCSKRPIMRSALNVSLRKT